MRLDKYLKVSRIIKRRTVAKEIVDQGRVTVNQRPAKAGTEIQIGDEIEIAFGQRTLTVRVEQVMETSRKQDASEMYTILKEERTESSSDFFHERD